MNQRKAKAIRKIVYGKMPITPRYVRLKRTGIIVNAGDMERVTDTSTGQSREIPRRRIYKHLKHIAKGLKIKDLQRVFLNDKKIPQPHTS
jgi:hypothetical protein